MNEGNNKKTRPLLRVEYRVTQTTVVAEGRGPHMGLSEVDVCWFVRRNIVLGGKDSSISCPTADDQWRCGSPKASN